MSLSIALTLFALVTIAHAQTPDPSPAPDSTPTVVVAPVPTPAPAPAPAAPLPTEAWVALFLAALGAIRGIVHGAAELLALIARRTANTVDDRIAERLDRMDNLLSRLLGGAPPPAAGPVSLPTPRGPERGVASGGVVLAMTSALALAMVTGTVISVASGCTASSRQTAIKAALVTADASRDAFMAHDALAQSAIVRDATTLEEGRARLVEYRAKRVKVELAFAVLYRAIAVAATANDDKTAAAVKAALEHAAATLAEFTGGPQT